ncbi:substrate-binding domain-containing protein [Phycicoccus endophyticus]|uniref:Substrate-binding domain-containing protein n=1 Tax=Phycicoccus endophyticus TaxID=1690220 RepID=A0A7G9R0D6_9MICO|nr:substrate-binding domain-containing protein [Phycicoccus endophyticus]NHI20126.1 sugar ABC transporter substrate-binding protein [Phycicoccus endophyticus]QNN49061.1 substrate-binding domain-containing protein [Phycicoccus endophyticus]GGL38178.1 ABC transporter substrate-binding protein [Phycicoccus endophyticus]
MTTRLTRLAGATLALGLTMTGLAACGDSGSGSGSSSDSGSDGGGGKKIALLLPENKTARYEAFDRPMFEEAVSSACSDCEVVYSNAEQDAAKQQQQAEAAITQGVDVLVLDAVDGKSAATIVQNAKSQGIPVIAYDRFVAGSDYYVSFDNEKVGQLQGQGLVDAMKAAGNDKGDIVMINGAPTDANAADFKKGAHSVLDNSGYTIKAEYDTPDWSPDKAQSWMEGQVASVKDSLVGVYAANDGTAGGAIAALKGGGVKPLPPVTGQDAELAAIQRIIAGDQALTIYKAIKPEAEDAAQNALALAGGEDPSSATDKEGVPATLLEPVVVTKDNIKDTIIADGFYSASDICTAEYADACSSLGIS